MGIGNIPGGGPRSDLGGQALKPQGEMLLLHLSPNSGLDGFCGASSGPGTSVD